MIITYFGKQFFKIAQGELVLAMNPVSKHSKTGIAARFGADIALISANHPDYNGVEQLAFGDREPFVMRGPGDYEVREIFFKGVLSESRIGGATYINTIYVYTIDGIHVAFLGALGDAELSKESREVVGNPDILFVPLGGEGLAKDGAGTLDAKAAAKLASTLEPKLVIPMDYDDKALKAFLKEMGEEGAEKTEKLTLKRKDLEGKEGDVVIIQTT